MNSGPILQCDCEQAKHVDSNSKTIRAATSGCNYIYHYIYYIYYIYIFK